MRCPVCGHAHRGTLVGFTGMNRRCAARARNGSTYLRQVYAKGVREEMQMEKRRNSASVDGYRIEANEKGIRIELSNGRVLSVLRSGTHVVLRQVPPRVRLIAELLAGWKL